MSLPSYKNEFQFTVFMDFFIFLLSCNTEMMTACSQHLNLCTSHTGVAPGITSLGNTLSGNKWDIEGDPVGKEIMILLSAKNSSCEAKIEKLWMQTRWKQWRENYNVK